MWKYEVKKKYNFNKWYNLIWISKYFLLTDISALGSNGSDWLKDLYLHVVYLLCWSQYAVMPSPILCWFGSSWLALYVVHSFQSAITESGSMTTIRTVGLQAAYHSIKSFKPGGNRVNTTGVKLNLGYVILYYITYTTCLSVCMF